MNIKTQLIVLFAFAIVGCTHYTGSGNIISESKSMGPFHGVHVSGPLNVEIRQGEPQSVIVETDDNLMKYVKLEVRNNVLEASIRNGSFTDAHFRMLVTVPVMNDLKASSAGEVEIFGVLKNPDQIKLNTSSAGSIRGQVDAPDIITSSSGGSEINITGNTRKIKAEASSGSSIKANQLLSEEAEAQASSGASIHLHASISVNAKASSGGNVSYRGGAMSVVKNESSGGEVEKEN